MKKLLISAVLGLVVASSQAANITVSVPAAGGFASVLAGAVKVNSFVFTSVVGTNNFQLWDIPSSTTNLTYVSPAYSTIVSYITNPPAMSVPGAVYTNYFGTVTTNLMLTNMVLVDVTNSVVSVVNNYPMRLNVSVPPNSTVTVLGPFVFNSGVFATNTSTGNGTVSANYYQ